MAEVPQLINYQGVLTDDAGDPVVDGPYLMKFAIWNDPASGASGNELWNSNFQTVQVIDGMFEYLLGTHVPMPHDLFATDTIRYLGITVGTDNEIMPRTRLVAAPYAYQALLADTADYALTIADETVSTLKIVDYAVTDIKISPDAVTESKIYDEAVTEMKIANNAVTQSKIAMNAVTESRISSNAVTNMKISHAAVTTDKIENGTIMFEDIASNGATTDDVMMWNGSAWTAKSAIPSGVILMWSGTQATIPNGWALCDGSGGTPDLRNRFIYGCDTDEAPGAIGGQLSVAHDHQVDIPQFTSGSNNAHFNYVWDAGGAWVAAHTHEHSIDPPEVTSTEEVISTMPPYYKLAYIMKL